MVLSCLVTSTLTFCLNIIKLYLFFFTYTLFSWSTNFQSNMANIKVLIPNGFLELEKVYLISLDVLYIPHDVAFHS